MIVVIAICFGAGALALVLRRLSGGRAGEGSGLSHVAGPLALLFSVGLAASVLHGCASILVLP